MAPKADWRNAFVFFISVIAFLFTPLKSSADTIYINGHSGSTTLHSFGFAAIYHGGGTNTIGVGYQHQGGGSLMIQGQNWDDRVTSLRIYRTFIHLGGDFQIYSNGGFGSGPPQTHPGTLRLSLLRADNTSVFTATARGAMSSEETNTPLWGGLGTTSGGGSIRTISNLPAGTYRLEAFASHGRGQAGRASFGIATPEFFPGVAPTITATRIDTRTNLQLGDTVTFQVTAADADGDLTQLSWRLRPFGPYPMSGSGSFTPRATATWSALNIRLGNAGGAPTTFIVSFTAIDTYSRSATWETTISVPEVTATPVTFTISDTVRTYTGQPQGVTVTPNPSLPASGYTITYNNSTTPPTDTGSYAVAVNVTQSGFSGSATGTLVINPAPVSFALSNLDQEWSGSARSITAMPSPAGVPMTITYSGSPTAPTDAGSYAVLVSPNSPNYTGAATATLFVRGRLTVASAPGGTVTGGGLFLPGETGPISVALAPLRTFNGWSFSGLTGGATLTGLATDMGNGVRMGSRSVTVTPNISVLTYQVTVETSPVAAGGSTLPSGVFAANAGQSYALAAAQASGDWYFSGWSLVSGTATLTANTPTDADPTPVANVSVTGNAVIRANYAAKAPTSITFSSPGANGTMPLASTPYALVATADSGAAVSFSILSTAPAGIATLAGSTITHRVPPLAGTVNLRMTAPATRTQLAASLDAAYQISNGAVGLVFTQAAPATLAISASTQGSSNFTPVQPNDYSDPQYLTAANAQANVTHFRRDGRLMSDAEILAKLQAEPTLKAQLANWLSGQGVQTDYVIALNTPPTPTYTFTWPTLVGAPVPKAPGQTLLVTQTNTVYDSAINLNTGQWRWVAR